MPGILIFNAAPYDAEQRFVDARVVALQCADSNITRSTFARTDADEGHQPARGQWGAATPGIGLARFRWRKDDRLAVQHLQT
jgi:hypothetical protein